ncbi:hypothetical protein R5M92_03850 [Halomonas sp. Bachu 37]|uniref:hypothetical protein n=1 Tax=Halomonas kashgarensis TaxID=3084920 RepID=UPI00321740F4
MIVTLDQVEMPWGGLLEESPERRWEHGWLADKRAWFFVRIGRIRNGVEDDLILLAPPMPQFEYVLPRLIEGHWLIDVMLVSPPSLNGLGRWAMDPLKSLYEVSSQRNPKLQGYIYEVDGRESMRDWPFDKYETLEEEKVIFSMSEKTNNWLNMHG